MTPARGASLAVAGGSLAGLALAAVLMRRRRRRSERAIFTYFEGHGRGEEVRLMLAACDIPWDDAVYGEPGAPRYLEQGPQMLALMRAGRLASDQVPLLVIDGLHLVQKLAILRYLARRHGMYGASPAEAAAVDILSDACHDWDPVISITEVIRGLRPAAALAGKNRRYLALFDRALRANAGTGPFLVGKGLTFVDVQLFQGLDQLSRNGLVALQREWPLLETYRTRVAAVPGVRAYLDSGRQPGFPGTGGARRYYRTAERVIPWAMDDSVPHPGMLSREWHFRADADASGPPRARRAVSETGSEAP